MNKLIDWVRRNKLNSILILLVLFLFFKKAPAYFPSVLKTSNIGFEQQAVDMAPASISLGRGGVSSESAPMPEVEDRMVVQESNLSIVVDDVRKSSDQILNKVNAIGGYMVSSSVSQPQESSSGTLTVRVPAEELGSMLEYLRTVGVKVTSENLFGRDVTDQYVDLDARLSTLNKTKAKFESILDTATKITDILEVQRQLIYIQDQIDRLKGQQEYLEKTAENAKITIYLSTDEWSLPYAPDDNFRPQVIFKQAVRALVRSLRGLVEKSIWVGVYGAVWLPIGLIALVVVKKINKRK